jgi:hypothetical protein
MNLEFNIFKLKDSSSPYQKWAKDENMHIDVDGEFIVVGEENLGDKPYIKIVPLEDDQICLVGGLTLCDLGYYVEEDDIYLPL